MSAAPPGEVLAVDNAVTEEELRALLGVGAGFRSTKGRPVPGNIDGYAKIKTTSKIFNLLIKKRGTYQQPITVKLSK